MIPGRELEVTDWRPEAPPCAWLQDRVAWALGAHFQLESYFLEIHLVDADTSARVNWERLSHEGPTDVITLDYAATPSKRSICGELFICPEIAAEYAKDYGVTVDEETLRYAVHGVLHLLSWDDQTAAEKVAMRAQEERALAAIAGRYQR